MLLQQEMTVRTLVTKTNEKQFAVRVFVGVIQKFGFFTDASRYGDILADNPDLPDNVDENSVAVREWSMRLRNYSPGGNDEHPGMPVYKCDLPVPDKSVRESFDQVFLFTGDVDEVQPWDHVSPLSLQQRVAAFRWEQFGTEHRAFRAGGCFVTGSQIGSVLGHSLYQTSHDAVAVITGVTNATFGGNAATEHGHKCEPMARQAFADWLQTRPEITEFELREAGIYVPDVEQHPWLRNFAYSPDDYVTLTFDNGYKETCLVEYKCPYRKRYERILPSYYDQMQLGMGIAGLTRCFFVVWKDGSVEVTQVALQQDYFMWMITEAATRLRKFFEC